MVNTLDHKVQLHLADYLATGRLEKINQNCTKVRYKDTFYTRYGKRALDILISLPALVITLPINLVIGVLVLCVLGRPLFFVQQRIGKNEKPFYIIKFRNMTNERDASGELLPAQQRLTRLGVFLRKTSLDELLNFWSILKGDMSIIGPRPLPVEYLSRYSARHRMRLKVRPGLECPLWVGTTKARTWNEQFENDIWYVENVSFFVDCMMFFKLIRLVFDRKSADERANCKKGSFLGYTEDGKAVSNYELDADLIEQIMASTN